MKQIFIILGMLIATISLVQCTGDAAADPICGTHNGNTLYLGPKGGCYYINTNGNKTYVDRSECHC